MKELSLEYLEGKIDYDTYPTELKNTRDFLEDIYKRNLYLRENKDVNQDSTEFSQFAGECAVAIFHAFGMVIDLLEFKSSMSYINDRSGNTLEIGMSQDEKDQYYCRVRKLNGNLRVALMLVMTNLEVLLRIAFAAIRLGKDRDESVKIAKELATYNGYKE